RARAERLRGNVEGNVIQTAGFNRNVTLSIGAAVRNDRMRHPNELLKAADEAVYFAKRSGRNRVCFPTAAGQDPGTALALAAPARDVSVTLTDASRQPWAPIALDLSLTGILVEFRDPPIPQFPVGAPFGVELRLGSATVRLPAVVYRCHWQHCGLFFPSVVRDGRLEPPESFRAMVATLERLWLQKPR